MVSLLLKGLIYGAIALGGCQAPLSLTSQPQPSPTVHQERVHTVPIVEGLEHPWGLAWLPNGDLLITERPGRVRRVRNGKLDPQAIAGVPEVSTVKADQLFASQQGGLLDIALHPRFEENRWIYFAYAHGTAQANRTRVARAEFDGEKLNNWEVIFEVGQAKPGGQHFGSRLTWLPDETLLVSIGDGGNPPVALDGKPIRDQAQNRASHLGKIIRLRDDGTVPPDNPFVNDRQAAPELWSYGHRNIQGMAFDPLTQRVWATEHGARGGDELNWIQVGKNYGWPLVSFSGEYGTGQPVAPVTSQPGMVDPVLVWTPSIAPSGLVVYTGDRHSNWRGNLFAGALVEKSIRRIEITEAGTVGQEFLIPIGQRVRDIRQSPDGYLYVLTDEDPGQLLRLEPTPSAPRP